MAPGPLPGLGLTDLPNVQEGSPIRSETDILRHLESQGLSSDEVPDEGTGPTCAEVLHDMESASRDSKIGKGIIFEEKLAYAIQMQLNDNEKGMKSLMESMKGFQRSLDNQTEMLSKHLENAEKQVERQEAAIH